MMDDNRREEPSRTASRPSWGAVIGAAVAGAAVTGGVAFLVVSSAARNGAPPGGPGGPGGAGGGPGFGPAPVEVATVVETVAAEPVQLVGSVSPLRSSLVASEVDGVVAEVAVDEGHVVEEGDLLARLRTTTMELDLEAARASQEEAAARLKSYETELRRLTELLEKEAISRQEYDQALADRDAQAQAVSRHRAEAARLEELVARARVTAPFPGEVTAVHVEVGEWVGRGDDVARLVDLDEVEITVPVPERYIAQARRAERERWPVEVTFESLEGTFTGHVKAVIAEANPQARTFPVLVALDNPEGRIQAGMLARVWAQVGEPTPTVLVPKDALVLRSGRTLVYRLAAGGAPATGEAGDGPGGPPGDVVNVEELVVEVGPGFGGWQVVEGSLSGGDRVVVRGNENLQPGMAVRVAGTADLPPPPEADPDRPLASGSTGDARR